VMKIPSLGFFSKKNIVLFPIFQCFIVYFVNVCVCMFDELRYVVCAEV
jgi:hypothetical protein